MKKKDVGFLIDVSFPSIQSVKEAGFVDHWLDAQITNTSQCLRPPNADRRDGISPLSIEDMAGSFLLLAGGETKTATQAR